MSRLTHTPAPWAVARRSVGKQATVVLDADRNEVCEAYASPALIAAAPDLLAALQRAEQMLSDWQHTLTDRGARVEPLLDISRAAIARATGEA